MPFVSWGLVNIFWHRIRTNKQTLTELFLMLGKYQPTPCFCCVGQNDLSQQERKGEISWAWSVECDKWHLQLYKLLLHFWPAEISSITGQILLQNISFPHSFELTYSLIWAEECWKRFFYKILCFPCHLVDNLALFGPNRALLLSLLYGLLRVSKSVNLYFAHSKETWQFFAGDTSNVQGKSCAGWGWVGKRDGNLIDQSYSVS